MTKYVIIEKSNGGVVTHENVDIDSMIIPKDAEIYDKKDNFEERVSQLIP